VAWWRKAATQGHAASQFALAEAYRSGKGIAQDDQEALYWYRQAAGQGNVPAQEALRRFEKR
jgi:TPR repeat protein